MPDTTAVLTPPDTAAPEAAAISRWWGPANIGLAAVAWLLPFARVLANLSRDRGDWAYSAADWLINYNAGFVRRGLAGEVLRHVPGVSDIVALEVWVLVLLAALAAMFAVLVNRVIRRTGSPWPLLLWLLPSGFIVAQSQYLWQPYWVSGLQFPFRKETLFYVVVVAAALAFTGQRSRRASDTGLVLTAAAFGLVLLPVALVHEGLMGLGIAGVGLIVWWAGAGRDRWVRLVSVAAMVGPALAGAALAVARSGRGLDPRVIFAGLDEPTRTWQAEAPGNLGFDPADGVPGAMGFLQMTLRDGMEYVHHVQVSGGAVRLWLAAAALYVAWALAVLLLTDRSGPAVRRTGAALLICMLVSIPMFAVGIDWGRFLVAVVNVAVIAALAGILLSDRRPRPTAPTPVLVTAAAGMLVVAALFSVQETGDPIGVLPHDIPDDIR